jgi:hypothetical protein
MLQRKAEVDILIHASEKSGLEVKLLPRAKKYHVYSLYYYFDILYQGGS